MGVFCVAALATSCSSPGLAPPTASPKHPPPQSSTSTSALTATTTSTIAPPPAPGSNPPVTWSAMVDGLNMDPAVVDCPSMDLCVFTGGTPIPGTVGRYEQAVSVSTGPFRPGSTVSGHLTPLPTGNGAQVYVSCPSTTLCVLSTSTAIYASTSPTSGIWVQQLVAPNGQEVFAGVSCSSLTFCAVVTRNGKVVLSEDPAGGPSAWSSSTVSSSSVLLTISCLVTRLCVAGGLGVDGTTGWVGVSQDPGGGPAAWSSGDLPQPTLAQGPGQFLVAVTCLTTSFCTASSGGLLVTTDPAAGPSAWQRVSASGVVPPSVAWCEAGGVCTVSGVGTYRTAGSGVASVGIPWPGVSCVTTSFCISVDASNNYQIQVGSVHA
jgi:hypothetical protein